MGALRALAVGLAALVLLTLALIVAFAFVGLYRTTEYYAQHATYYAPRARLSAAYAGLKTGDVLLFVSATHAPTTSMLAQTYFSHAGVLVREGELVYVAETSAGNEIMPDPRAPATGDLRMRPGADLTPLLARLKYYTGLYYLMPLERPLEPARAEALKREAERLRREAYPYPSAAKGLRALLGGRPAARHCFQHTAHLLDTAGLTPPDRAAPLAAAGFVGACREVCALPGRPLPGGHRYRAPVQLLYDIGLPGPEPGAADGAP